MSKAFTMIELVFAIVVVGILSAIAIPKLAATRDDAVISRGAATISALRSAIATERQKRILKGDFTEIDGAAAENLLEYGLPNEITRNGDDFKFTAPDGSTCTFTVQSNKLIGTCSMMGL